MKTTAILLFDSAVRSQLNPNLISDEAEGCYLLKSGARYSCTRRNLQMKECVNNVGWDAEYQSRASTHMQCILIHLDI